VIVHKNWNNIRPHQTEFYRFHKKFIHPRECTVPKLRYWLHLYNPLHIWVASHENLQSNYHYAAKYSTSSIPTPVFEASRTHARTPTSAQAQWPHAAGTCMHAHMHAHAPQRAQVRPPPRPSSETQAWPTPLEPQPTWITCEGALGERLSCPTSSPTPRKTGGAHPRHPSFLSLLPKKNTASEQAKPSAKTVSMGEEAVDPPQALWCLNARETPLENIIPNRKIILILKAFK